MQYPICRHIKTNGLQCGAPALSTRVYCYFHDRLHQRHSSFRYTPATRNYLIPGQHVELTALEDRESIQIALSVVINGLATGQLDTKRAATLLYGLQIASNNARRLDNHPYTPDQVRTVEPSPEGLDLAEPGAMLEFLEIDDEADMDENDDEEDEDEEESRGCISRRSRTR